MKIYFLLSVLFVSTTYSYAKEKSGKNSVKGLIIREIMNKVSNITLNLLTKVSEPKKAVVLKKIEKKLKSTAKNLVEGDKYVKIIMKEFREKAFAKKEENPKNDKIYDDNKNENKDSIVIDESHDTQENNAKEDDEEESGEMNITTEKSKKENTSGIKKPNREFIKTDVRMKSHNSSIQRKVFDPVAKQHIIKDIAKKIESMAKSYIKDSQTLDQKQAILKKIEGRILESSKRKHLEIHNKHNELKAYTDLITQGLELSMKRLLRKGSRRVGAIDSEESINSNETQGMNLKYINRYKAFFAEVLSEISLDPHCTDVVEGICLRIAYLHKLPCGDGKIIGLNQLCDGVFDCWNEADETNCTDKAAEKIQRSINIMSDVEKSITTKCFQPLVGGPIFSHHHAVLLNMLKSQLEVIQKYKSPAEKYNLTTSKALDQEEALHLKMITGDASTLVSSLSSALEINLCTSSDKTVNENKLTRKSMLKDTDEFKNIWYPKTCICNRNACKSDDCDSRCKRICWQKYSLNRWECQSVIGGASVPMDIICDGKLDCFDESDETLCAAGNPGASYEANVLFIELLDLLSLKSLSNEYEKSRTKLVALAGLVRQLHKLSTNYNVDLHKIKTHRDEFFSLLVHIYADAISNSNLEELDRTHEFLVFLKEKMVDAMKRSHTGNENVIPSAGCYCRNGTCALVRCPQNCISTCSVELVLTRYSCNVNNQTVHIKAVCNGKKDCPNEEDEKNCKIEVCRGLHLVVLRNNIQKAGSTLLGTAVGEALDSWKVKVLSSLRIAEKGDRPNHKVLEDMVHNTLHDLVAAYASMEDSRRNSAERGLKEFVHMSDIVKETLKLCGN